MMKEFTTSMTDFEEIMHSYGLDPSNPDHMDELLYRINNENADDFSDDIQSVLAEYADINDFYDEYDDIDVDVEWID